VDRGELLAALAQYRGSGASPESWLAAVTTVQILQRMLYNLYSVYRQRGSGAELHRVIDQLLCIEPWNVDLIGERGLLRYRMNDARGAVRDLEQYVEHSAQPGPDGPPRGLEIARRALTDLHHRLDPLTGGRHDDQ
jgi:regulator of sirC expression with transglutaminase-like and TPR domain